LLGCQQDIQVLIHTCIDSGENEEEMKILLAVDDTPASADAAEIVTSQEWPPGTHVRVLSVAWGGAQAKTPAAQGQAPSPMRAYEVTMAIARFLCSKGFLADSVVRFGKTHTGIVDEAKDWSADLIIVTGHPSSVTRGWASDESTRWLVKHAPCSVKVVSNRL
jgi:nucleotide-binding universal stress UspA family protein